MIKKNHIIILIITIITALPLFPLSDASATDLKAHYRGECSGCHDIQDSESKDIGRRVHNRLYGIQSSIQDDTLLKNVQVHSTSKVEAGAGRGKRSF